MKNTAFLLFAFLFCLSSTAQIEIDKKIVLTGTGSDAKIEGIEEVINPNDAVNKAYVDDAISSVAGGVSMTFSLSSNVSSVLIGQGTSNASAPVVLTSQFVSGAGAPVSLSLSGVPSNVTFNLTPSGGFPSFTSTLVFTAGASASPGVYPIVVSATGGGATQTANISLTVVATKTVFVTSTTQNGNLGGLAGADAVCNARAAAGGLSGTYVAWLSTNSVQAKNRITDGLYARTDGQIIALSKADLIDGSIVNPINRSEFGTVPSGESQVFTGTDEFGVKWIFSSFPGIDYSCVGWTSSSNPYDHTGEMTATNTFWTQTSAGQGCSSARRLYCFKQ